MSGEIAIIQPRRSQRQRLTREERQQRKRQKIEEKETKQKMLDSRPYLEYEGKVYYLTEFSKIEDISDHLLSKANNAKNNIVFGFDMEWPFSFQTGSGKTAVIQISEDLTTCFILHVSKLGNLPESFKKLLIHSKVRLTGVNIVNDVRKLARDFTGFDVNKMIANCIELGHIAGRIDESEKRRWSMEALIIKFLSKNINKDKKVRMSKWDVIPLTEQQQKYAATDAYASLLLYQTLTNHEAFKRYLTFDGKLVYHTEMMDIALVCDDLLIKLNNSSDALVFGFDMEWPFSFQTGPGKTAVIQISPDLKNCLILQVSNLKKLPKSVSELLLHPKVKLSGINIVNDIRKLARDFDGLDFDKISQNCIDLGHLANMIVPIRQRWSMEKLVNHFLKKNIDKNKKVRMSKWNIIPLSEEQQRYAAIDAHASLLLYHTLKGIEDAITSDENEETENKPPAEN